jgi:hypothetical protein
VGDTRVEAIGNRAQAAGRRARHSTWVDRLARFGLTAKAFSYGLVAVLALGLATGAGGKATDREGALETIAGETWGTVVLVGLALGFAAYALWRLLSALFDREDDGATGLAKRGGYLGRAVIYGALTVGVVELLIGQESSSSQTEHARQATGTVLDWPAGRWLVALGGLCLLGAGLYNGYRAVTQKFEERWRTGAMSEAERRWGARIGTVGLLSRMVVFGLIGSFLVKAAAEYDASEAIGLDGALRKLAAQPYGAWLLGLVAVGLLAYGLYCLVEARYRDV